MAWRVIYAANLQSPEPFETEDQARGYLWHRFGVKDTHFSEPLIDGSKVFYYDPRTLPDDSWGAPGREETHPPAVLPERYTPGSVRLWRTAAGVEIIARIVSDD